MWTLDHLKALAFHQGPAYRANQLIYDVREGVRARHGTGLNYEVSLIDKGLDHLLEIVGPRLALYLRAKRRTVSNCADVFLSIFIGETLYFVRAADFFRFVREILGMDEEAFGALARIWGRTGRAAIGALPPGRKPN